ncbi:MAG: saccharopine dehydrogenase NADP-binding domain-containing protein [Ignavibacteriae bacterium]|nr:saccharopine dehydrogenase NADP-binding domain-containing protein [Ignavibacteriota bacterium]
MRALVIGAGMMGSAEAYDLVNSEHVEQVFLADKDEARAKSVVKTLGSKAQGRQLDIAYYDDVVETMQRVDVALGATSYQHNVLLTKAAIEAGVHFCDLGGNMDVVYKQMELDAKAKQVGVLILPNCGLAPGMACAIAAGAAKKFSSVDELHIRVGGLPQHPQPPLNYQLVFSPEGLVNEYLEPAERIHDGELQTVASMLDVEELEFPQPLGKMEAFNTSGGSSTLVHMFKGKVKELDYKTIRYKGHCEKFKLLLELGFGSAEPIVLGDKTFTARELFEQMLLKKLPMNGPDIVLMRVSIKGAMHGTQKELTYEMIDYFDKKLQMTSMMRTTAFPTSIIAQMAADGTITQRGVLPPEQCVPLEPFLCELQKRNIIINETLS